ncbi:lytic transglycosylase domain-containing protein [Microvirga sp. BT688]|uniref:transglycosylase SLT domain-containing protein n=1 Tax=Microvirga sp. TaxID=1873136 RepID=UPI001681D955|nr:lytic transglycosylase domain-containing protein [Microvirga sp.]MBD2745540.1 lytic transglycosylase domain-containing protein [Microvirga sp.]
MSRNRIGLLIAAALAGSTSSVIHVTSAAAQPQSGLCEREMMRASALYGVPLGMLYSVGLTETGNRGSLQPYAMNVEGKAVFSNNAVEAIQKFEQASRSGARLIDMGCMQINHLYHREKFPSLESMLNPRMNVEYAARFLKELKGRHETWTMAVARYHAGPNNDPAQKRYVCRVIANMVASGFGAWTPGARSFCEDAPGLKPGQTAAAD